MQCNRWYTKVWGFGLRSDRLRIHEQLTSLLVKLVQDNIMSRLRRNVCINDRLKATISLLLRMQESLHMAHNTCIFSAVRRNSLSDFPFPAHSPSWSPSMAPQLASSLFTRFPKPLSSKDPMHLLCILSTTISTAKP